LVSLHRERDTDLPADKSSEQERLPFAEGWQPPVKFDQSDLNHGYTEMMKSGKHGNEEAKLVGIGTLVSLKAAVLSLGANLIKSPSPRV